MRGMIWTLVALLTASEAAAQERSGEERREAVPPLPGSGVDEPAAPGDQAPQTEQTPPVQEGVLPEPVPDEQEEGKALDGQSPQPKFDRDATPRSTEPEREGQDGVQEYQGPATGGAAPEETPETRVPRGAPDEEVNPHEPMLPPGDEEVPDSRFETFETQADDPAGTPGLQVPSRPREVQGTPPL